MSSLVSDFIINPVLRQARRFSEISRSTFGVDDETATIRPGPIGGSEATLLEDPGLETAVDLETSSTDLPATPERHIASEERITASPVIASSPTDHLGFPVTPPKRTGPLPEDDGMGYLRARIHSINGQDLEQTEKSKRIHDILTERYRASRVITFPQFTTGSAEVLSSSTSARPPSPSGLDSLKFWRAQEEVLSQELFKLTAIDVAPTFAPIRQPKSPGDWDSSHIPATSGRPPLGCQHYERNVKLQCSTCKKWYTCRFCHDAAETHILIRSETKNMLCMLCSAPQKAGEICIACGEITASYYCDVCKLWENRQSKPIYHCNDCGICRRGLGLGKDFFHCKTCRACITTSIETSHKCIERSTDCDCPICGEYMFTSPKPVVFMTCGHSIHKKCYDQHMKVSYKCPICNKSLVNMETQFRNLDLVIQGQPMPSEFQDTKAVILCNDCSGRCTVPYHWLGLKCTICSSYNTVELQILGGLHDGYTPITVEMGDLITPSTRDTDEPEPEPASTVAMSTAPRGSRVSSILASRRRHSSNGIDIQQHNGERAARSLSPLNFTTVPFANIDMDVDSDNDILGFWRSGDGVDDDDDEDDDDESDDESEHNPEEDEEEDANEIMLFGHR